MRREARPNVSLGRCGEGGHLSEKNDIRYIFDVRLSLLVTRKEHSVTQHNEFACAEAWHLNFRYQAVEREAVVAESMALRVMAEMVLEDLKRHISQHGCGVALPSVSAGSAQ